MSTLLHRGCSEKVRTVTRMQTAAASLVAALPAGILATVLVMMFLTHMENLNTGMMAIAGSTLIVAAALLLMPFGILLFSGKAATKAAPKAAAGGKAADADEAVVTADDELLADDDGEINETVEFDPSSVSEADVFDDEPTDEDVFEEVEEELPKKKGKKK